MNTLKRALAFAALGCFGFSVIALMVIWVTGQLQAQIAWSLVPLTAFLMFGLMSLGINWLQKLKKEAAAHRDE